jgi:hypothetical protein
MVLICVLDFSAGNYQPRTATTSNLEMKVCVYVYVGKKINTVENPLTLGEFVR